MVWARKSLNFKSLSDLKKRKGSLSIKTMEDKSKENKRFAFGSIENCYILISFYF